jgi:hypothetical protein
MTATSDLPRVAAGEPRLTFRIDHAAAALGICPSLANDLIHTRQAGSVTAGRHALISRTHLDDLLVGDA